MDNPFFIFTILGFESFLVYFLFFRRYSWYYLLTPSGFFLSLFLVLISVSGCVNYYLWDWRDAYSSTDTYLVVILITPAIFIFTSLLMGKRLGILVKRLKTFNMDRSGSYPLYIYSICICLVIVLVKVFPQSALFQLLKNPDYLGQMRLINEIRHAFDISFSGKPIIYLVLIMNNLLSPLAIFLVYLTYLRKRTIRNLIGLAILSTLLSVVAFLSLHKATIIFLFTPVLFYYLINNFLRKNIIKLFVLLIFIFLLVNVMYAMHYGDYASADYKSYFHIESIMYRMFYPPTRNVLNYIEFAELNGCRGEYVYRIFTRLAGTEYSRHANEIFFWFTNIKNEAATLNAAFTGTAYLGWGLWGVIIHSILLQFYFTSIEIIYGKLNFNNLVLASLITTSVIMSTLISTDAVAFMNSWGGMYAFFWALGLLAFSGKSFCYLHCLKKASKVQSLS